MNLMKRWTAPLTIAVAVTMLVGGCADNTTTTKTKAPITPNVSPYVMNKPVKTTAERLEKMAERIPDVNDATVITFGNTVLIGLDINNKLDRTKADTVKYAVAHALRNQGRGKNVLVTADADLGKRILNVRNGVMKGKPVSSFATELGDIIGRIAPQGARR